MLPLSNARQRAHSPQIGPERLIALKQHIPIDLYHPLLQKWMQICNLANTSNRPETQRFRRLMLAAFAQEEFSIERLHEAGFVIGRKAWKSARETTSLDEQLSKGLTPSKGGRPGHI